MSKSIAFFDGKFIPTNEAQISIMTHALHYGTAVFEGIRGNWNNEKNALSIFRMKEHYQRLLDGCKLMMIDLPYSCEDLCNITTELIKKSGYKEDVYIRPLAYKSAEIVANLKLQDLESNFCLIVIPFGKYLTTDHLRCCTSAWRRIDDTMIPPRFKISGIYVNSILAKTEATLAGFDEAILLNSDGHVCEGTGENLFLAKDNMLHTPSLSENVLPGITRNTIINLAKNELNIPVIERSIDRSEIYVAEECFLTGTAAHVTAVTEIDRRQIGQSESIGPITKLLQGHYFEIVKGNNNKYLDWCSLITV